MKVQGIIKEAEKVCLNHYDELATKIYNAKIINFMLKTLESRTIWGGNGDADIDMYLGITEKGWTKYIVETETGMYQKGSGLISDRYEYINQDELKEYINGEECTIREFQMFINKCDELKSKYNKEFNSNYY